MSSRFKEFKLLAETSYKIYQSRRIGAWKRAGFIGDGVFSRTVKDHSQITLMRVEERGLVKWKFYYISFPYVENLSTRERVEGVGKAVKNPEN